MKPPGKVPTEQAQNDSANAADAGAQPPRKLWRSLHLWPALAAIGLAGLIAFDLSSGSKLAAILAASGLVYLGAAALQKPSAAWPVFLVSFVVISANRAGWLNYDATWVLLAIAGLFFVYGVLRGRVRPASGLPLQTIAMIACGAAAAIALFVGGSVGAYLVAAGLLAHAAWDVYHHWTNKVVVRSMAEFCFVLDTLLALAIVIVTVRG